MWNTVGQTTREPEQFGFYLAQAKMYLGSQLNVGSVSDADTEVTRKNTSGEDVTITDTLKTHEDRIDTGQLQNVFAMYMGEGKWVNPMNAPIDVVKWREFPGDELSLLDLQEQHQIWEDHNFPGQRAENPLLGLAEEVGELTLAHIREKDLDEISPRLFDTLSGSVLWGSVCHSVLKQHQNIRVNENHTEELKNAATNLIKILKNLLGKEEFEKAVLIARDSSGIVLPNDNSQIPDSCGDILIYLANYANKVDLNLQAAQDVTWGHVKSRDWKKDPSKGGK